MSVDTKRYKERQRGLIPADLMKFRWLEEISMSPDGTMVAYTVRRPVTETNGYATHLYVRELKADEPQRITSGSGTVTAITWSGDSSQIAYSYNDENNNSVRVWSVKEQTEQVYPIEGYGLGGLDWSPDGQRLVGVRWTTQRYLDDYGQPDYVPAPTIKVIRRLRYKQDGAGWVHDRFMQVWVLELKTGDLVQITTSECDYNSPKWSNRGDKIAFVGVAREQNIPMGYGQILIYDFANGTTRPLLPEWQGTAVSPAWSPDDRFIAFAGHNYPPPVNRRNFWQPHLADVEAGTAVKLGEDLDEEVGNYAVADQRKSLSNITIKWAKNDEWAYFLLTEQGATNLYRINISGEYEKLVSGDSVTFEYSPTAGGIAAFGQSNPINPGELFIWDNGKIRQLTDLNPWLRDHKLSVPESYWYDGVEGAKVHAWLMKPLDFEEGRKYPTILYVHCSMFSWDFNHEYQIYANAGYAVAYFNQRGTTAGYGQAWTHASQGDQGGKDYEEIMLGVDDLCARDFIDESRLGVTGGSCGGFMTNWIIGHTDRFVAAVTQRSIANQISYIGTSDIGPECTEGETGTNPWKNLQSSWQQSPLAHVINANTPLLIIHSDEDFRCGLDQAEQLFAALRWMGKEVEMVIFEGESHGLSRGGRPGNRIERQRRILQWFVKYMGTDPA